VIDEVQTEVGPIALLFDNCDIFAQSLLGILELRFEAFDVLFVHHLLVGLLESHLSSQVLYFAVRI